LWQTRQAVINVLYGYATTGAIDDLMSRLATIGDGTGTLSGYKYLGANQIVEEDYCEAGVRLSYLGFKREKTL
jgi:hypothetical protein